jgi:hypothetical protein
MSVVTGRAESRNLRTVGGYRHGGYAVPPVLSPSLHVLLEELVECVAERVAELLVERGSARAHDATGELLSVGEAADVLRCKPQRVYDL